VAATIASVAAGNRQGRRSIRSASAPSLDEPLDERSAAAPISVDMVTGTVRLDWRALQAGIAGHVVLPHAPEYESLRRPPVARFDDGFLAFAESAGPEAIVLCRDPADASATIEFARRFGLDTAARSGGHCFTGHSYSRGIVMDVTPLASVSLAGGVATVGGGTRLGDLYETLDAEGLTIPAGCGPSVGIAGLTLGGGVGILGRRYGLTCDQLLGAQIVLADGRIVECDERHDEDLFWALRGAGGGNFGVVTSFRFRTVPAPAATGFHLVWPYAAAAAVVEAWQEWAPDAPDELAASVLITLFGDLDQPPLVNVFGAMIGTESETLSVLEEIVTRIGSDPATTAYAHGPYVETKRYLGGLGDQFEQIERAPTTQPVHAFSKSEFFAQQLPAEAIDALLAHFAGARVDGQSRELDFMPWGGAYNRVPADATAFPHRDARMLVHQTVVFDRDVSSDAREGARRWLARSWETVHPWGTGGVYANFREPDRPGPERAYYGTNFERLLSVKRSYDPDGFFRFR
jgi:FAD/FMN-containing dehydrogenase